MNYNKNPNCCQKISIYYHLIEELITKIIRTDLETIIIIIIRVYCEIHLATVLVCFYRWNRNRGL